MNTTTPASDQKTATSSQKAITSDRIGGMLLGLFVGDALGAAYEFKRDAEKLKTYNGYIKDKVTSFNRFTKETKNFPLGTVTDDSEMSIALIRALCQNGKYDRGTVVMEYLKWANSPGTTMMGKNTRALLKGVTTLRGYENRMAKAIKEAQDNKQEIAQSNGSLMRASPLAVLQDFNNVYTDCDITNPNPVNRDCSTVYVVMLWLLLRGYTLEEIWPMIKNAARTQEVKDLLNFVEEHPPIISSDGILKIKDGMEFLYLTEAKKKSWVLNALYCALIGLHFSFIQSKDNLFGMLLDWIIQHPGSDTDTNAAIAGAVIGAKIGYQVIIANQKNMTNVSLVLNPQMTQGDSCNSVEYRLSVKYFTELCTGLYNVAKGLKYDLKEPAPSVLPTPKIKLNIIGTGTALGASSMLSTVPVSIVGSGGTASNILSAVASLTPDVVEYKSYDCTLDTVMQQLDKYGVAVIPNILSLEKCSTIRQEIWDEIKYVTKGNFDIKDQKTWSKYYEYFTPLHGMMLQHHSLGQMEPLWKIRESEEVQQVFAKIWNVPKEKLITSFDALSISLPHEVTKRGYYRGAQGSKDHRWTHTDQSPTKKGLQCVQGFVNLYPVNEGDATLLIYEGSHKWHERYFIDRKISDTKEDWHRLDEVGYQYFAKAGCKPYRVKAGVGSIVLWDSRTFHQGGEPLKERKEPNFRMVSYVCMMSRDGVSQGIMNKRIKAFQELRVTNHWPNNPKLFPKLPRTYGNSPPEINMIHPPVLNAVRQRLIGMPETASVVQQTPIL